MPNVAHKVAIRLFNSPMTLELLYTINLYRDILPFEAKEPSHIRDVSMLNTRRFPQATEFQMRLQERGMK